MSSAKMTLIGMNQFFTSLNDDLFKNLTLPEGIDKQTLTDNILLTGGEFEVIYSNPTAMQNLIGIWSRREQATFKRWIDALSIDYNPLENYDRIEHWTDNLDGLEHTANTGTSADIEHTANSGSNSSSGSSTSSGTSNTTNSDTSELQKSAYDESGYSAYEKTINSGTVGQTTSDSTTTSMQNTTSDTGDRTNQGTTSNTEDHTTDNNSVHDGRIHGNLGVTTSQQMLTAELDLGYWNLYSKITELFLKEFVIPVYA